MSERDDRDDTNATFNQDKPQWEGTEGGIDSPAVRALSKASKLLSLTMEARVRALLDEATAKVEQLKREHG